MGSRGAEPEPEADWEAWIAGRTEAIAAAGRWRSVRTFDALGPSGRLVDDADGATAASASGAGRVVTSFASNDYLGLTAHPAVRDAAMAAIARWGTGSGAARLVVGSRPVHRELEEALADWRGTEAALLLPTGFAANLAVLSTFGVAGTTIVSDELNHASIVDGSRLARARVAVYRHGDVDDLVAQLRRAAADGATRTIIVTDTVFSMDGDIAPLDGILDAARAHRSLLVLDEAHAVLGPHPTAEDLDGVDVLRVGTLSKTLGSLGGFVAGPRRYMDLLVNLARPFIFTTGSTPADTAAALAALAIVRSPEGEALRERLRAHIERVRPGHPSPIIPVVVGAEADAVRLASALLARGILVPAIRPPTVPVGTSRLRVALSASHRQSQVEALTVALAELGPA